MVIYCDQNTNTCKISSKIDENTLKGKQIQCCDKVILYAQFLLCMQYFHIFATHLLCSPTHFYVVLLKIHLFSFVCAQKNNRVHS